MKGTEYLRTEGARLTEDGRLALEPMTVKVEDVRPDDIYREVGTVMDVHTYDDVFMVRGVVKTTHKVKLNGRIRSRLFDRGVLVDILRRNA